MYNLGTGEGYSVLDMVKAFEAASKVTIPYEMTDRRPGDIAIMYACPKLAEAELGWKAKRGLPEMCKSFFNFLSSSFSF